MSRIGFNKRRGTSKRALRLEPLESRAMLAGNITASISGETLFLRGDNASNLITLTETEEDTYLVAGLGTSVNQSFEGEFVAEGIRFINVDLRGGNDSFEFTGLTDAENGSIDLDGHLIVNGGDGNDTVTVDGADFDLLRVDGVRGADSVGITGSAAGTLIVTGNFGNDTVTIGTTTVEHGLVVDTGDNNDTVEITDSDAESVVVATGRGNDGVALGGLFVEHGLTVATAAGADGVSIEGVSAGSAVINTGTEADGVLIAGLELDHGLVVVTSSGNDGVSITGLSANHLVVDLGNNNDDLFIADVLIDTNVVLVGGTGNDDIVLGVEAEATNEIHGDLTVNTGTGNDTATLSDIVGIDNFFMHLGTGDDIADIAGLVIDNDVFIDASTGNDAVTISATSANNVTILMGTGNDTLTVTGSSANRFRADGGPGRDRFISDDTNETDEESVVNFEIHSDVLPG